jgi:V8-like Glu-specific endopeptidase
MLKTKNDADQWVKLNMPEDVFKGMVPKTVRYDEKSIGLPKAKDLNVCFDGDDDRKPFKNTFSAPNRWVCKLQVAYFDPVTSQVSFTEGSGLLIGDRYVLTAAHMLMDIVTNGKGEFLRAIDAAAVVVIPGLDGKGRGGSVKASDTMPFGWSRGVSFRTNSLFRKVMQKDGRQFGHLDYAVIKLAQPVGRKRFEVIGQRRFGYWGAPEQRGRTRIRVVTPQSLRNVKVNVVGYPADKCLDRPKQGPLSEKVLAACRPADRGSVAWYAFDRIRSAGAAPAVFAQLTLNHDVAPAMSGGPVWLRWKGIRNLIGINHACTRNMDGSILSSSATRITNQVKRDIQTWIS